MRVLSPRDPSGCDSPDHRDDGRLHSAGGSGFLLGGAFFDYQGEVAAWRLLQAADGQDDKVKRFLLVRPQGQYEDIISAVAFAGHDLPVSVSGVPPMETLKSPPQVRKGCSPSAPT